MSDIKTSTTAYAVIAGLANLASMPRWRGYFSQDTVELNRFFKKRLRDSCAKRLIGALPPACFLRVMDLCYIPGMAHHFLFRKKLVETQMHGAIAAGVRQVVVMGAGLDMVAARTANAQSDALVVELDLPGTQQAKKQFLQEYGYPLPANLHFRPADLTRAELAPLLAAVPGFDAAAPTFVVLEGVLMYLSEAQVSALFAGMAQCFTGELTVLFGAIAIADQEASLPVKMMDRLLNRGQEGTKWHCKSEKMSQFLAGNGYALRRWLPYRALQAIFREQSELSRVPAEDENYYLAVKMSQTDKNTSSPALSAIPYMDVKA